MAIPHLSHKNFLRSSGKSAVAAAAYRSGEILRDERTDELKDYSRKRGVLHSEILLPKDAPEWSKDREQLWNAVERREDQSTRRAQARVAQEIEIALPHEMTLEQNVYALKDFIKAEFTRKGKVVDLNIHAPHRDGDQRNVHAHLLFSERDLTKDGFDKKDRDFNDKNFIERLRLSWEKHINHHLERWGFDVRIDMRSLEDQGIEREPQQHMGPVATQMQRRGAASDRVTLSRGVTRRNQEYAALKAEMQQIAQDLAEAVRAEQKAKRVDYMTKKAQDIRLAWTVSDGGIAFLAALGEQGLYATQAENGQYAVIDSETGFKHYISEKAYGDTAKDIRALLDKVQEEGLIISTVEEYFEDCKRQREERSANNAYKASFDLNQTQAEIRLSFGLTASGQSFAEALEAKGIILAEVTVQDAYTAKVLAGLRTHEKDVPEWKTRPPFREGDLVAVDQWGHTYPLTERTTGHRRDDIAARCATVNRAELLSVADAKTVMREVQEGRAKEYEHQRQQHAGNKAASLYDHADMASVQRDALRHIRDAHKSGPRPFRPEDHRRLQEAKENRKRELLEEAKRGTTARRPDAGRPVGKEMTDSKQVQATRLAAKSARSRSDEGGRELRQEPEP